MTRNPARVTRNPARSVTRNPARRRVDPGGPAPRGGWAGSTYPVRVTSSAGRTGAGLPPAARRAVVDYALQRRARLADLFAGRASADDVCDAHPYLLRAAKFYGQPVPAPCPVCRKDCLFEVRYVYGDALKATAGQAKTQAELTELATKVAEFSVYVVEVCSGCSWNHLTTSYVMGRGVAGPARRRSARQ